MDIELNKIINRIDPIDRTWIEKAKERTARLVMPLRALGILHDISEKLCGIQRTLHPRTDQKAVLIMAGDHGVVKEGVNAYPQEITGEMVGTFFKGGAGINALAQTVDAQVWVADLGCIPDLSTRFSPLPDRLLIRKIKKGTDNFALGPAMSREDAVRSLLSGYELADSLFRSGVDILATGDMGIGNTTPSAAIGMVITGRNADDMVGRGTGIDDQGLENKRGVVRKGIERNRPDPKDGLDVLAKVGGFEIGGIAGCILAGAVHQHPVVIDGFISTAGALIAHTLCPSVIDYLFAGHCSAENGHRLMLSHLGLEPILTLNMRLGEGTGAALAMGIIDGAVRVFREVMTFEEAAVTEKKS
ncbi:MAG: nicotinate-nucleotide--dimethylbenzimidazole phosphoribosyltransferase [Thermodesulfobacteriota bacterium]